MRVIINNNNFGDIGTAVFYRFNKYIPTGNLNEEDKLQILKDYISDKIQYKGNKTVLDNNTFNEYDFSYKIEKFKFNDQLRINYLDQSSKDLIGKKTDDLEKIESLLFPTNSIETEDSKYSYFGAGLISNQIFLNFDIEGATADKKGYWKLELYEDSIEENNNIISGTFIDSEILNSFGEENFIKPILTIIFGPENNTKNNSSDMYYSFDPMLNEKDNNTRLDLLEYKKLLEEINHSKIISILMSNENESIDINLSYKSWIDSINPNRNMNNYYLRNDEYWSSKNSIDYINNINGTNYWVDLTSGNLLSNQKLEDSHPILNNKLKKLENNKNKFSSETLYELGDVVEFNGNLWESICNNNIKNSPDLSTKWILKGYIDNIFSQRISIGIYPDKSGYVDPGENFTIIDKFERKEFIITEQLGYELDLDNPCSISPEEYLKKECYELSTKTLGEGEKINIVTITSWEDIIKTGTLIFNFKQTNSKIIFISIDNNVQIPYNEWKNYFNEPNLEINKITVLDELIDLTNFNGSIDLSPNKEVKFYIPKLLSHKIDSVESTSILSGESEIKKIEVIDNINEYIIKDITDYSTATYKIYLSNKYLTITVIESINFEVSKIIDNIIYGGDYNLKFYPKENNTFNYLTIESESNKIDISSKEIGEIIEFDNSIIKLDYDELNSIYNLSISNISSNYKISLIS